MKMVKKMVKCGVNVLLNNCWCLLEFRRL